ncbi:putative phosphohydrolase [Aeromonas phage ACP1]
MTLQERLEQEDLLFGLKGYDVDGFLHRWKKELSLLESTCSEDPKCSYHNFSHALGVGMIMEKLLEESCKFSVSEKHRGVVAAIYHDFLYGGHKDDSLNIRITIDSFMFTGRSVLDHAVDRDFVCTIIAQTRYPYKPDDRLTDLGKLLRDADRLYGLVFSSTQMVNRLYLALGHKLGVYYLNDFVERNIKFLEEFECFSQQGKKLYDQTVQQAIDIHKRVLWND